MLDYLWFSIFQLTLITIDMFGLSLE